MSKRSIYQEELEKIIKEEMVKEIRPSLLLHVCCAPCSSYCLEYLREFFDITVFFYNPNITEQEEYEKRRDEEIRLIGELNRELDDGGEVDALEQACIAKDGVAASEQVCIAKDGVAASEQACMADDGVAASEQINKPGFIKYVIGDYTADMFFDAVKGYEDCPERGDRCRICFALRLDESARVAKTGGFDYFTTSLTISPLKDAAVLNEIGNSLGKKWGIAFLPSDFKKKGGYQRSIELSEKYGLYRQNYCGCVFSKRNRIEEHQS